MRDFWILAISACTILAMGIFVFWQILRGYVDHISAYVVSRLDGYARFNPVRELLRAKLLARGKHEGNAYHVTEKGVVLRVDAESFYAALFAGVYDFWELVEVYGSKANRETVPVEQMELGDGEGRLARIHSNCGETYLDAVFPDDLPYPYLCTRATADEFKKAIVERQAEAAKRAKGDGRVEDGLCVHGAVV